MSIANSDSASNITQTLKIGDEVHVPVQPNVVDNTSIEQVDRSQWQVGRKRHRGKSPSSKVKTLAPAQLNIMQNEGLHFFILP